MKEIVYILINEAMPGFVKVGRTSTSVEQRMKGLDNTSMPLPFECYHAATVVDSALVESRIHAAYKDRRVRQRREFFQVDPEQIRNVLLLAQIDDVTPRGDVVAEPEDIKALNKARKRRGRFSFEVVGISVGAILTFSKDDSVSCVVVDDTTVEFEGEHTSLSKSALAIVHRLGYTWKALAGPDYWQFEGETLTSRRLRLEEENTGISN